MIALLNQIPSEAKIRKQLKKIVFGHNMSCPHCRSRKTFRSENRYRCKKCRKPFTILSGTWLKDMKIHLRTFYALLWCWTQQIPVRQTEKLCHINEETAYHWVWSISLTFARFYHNFARQDTNG